MATANPHGIPMTASQYAAQWAQNATRFSSDGVYAQLAGLAGMSGIVIEVGCGSGESTLELVEHADKVIVFEANKHLVGQTQQKLQSRSIPTQFFKKGAATAAAIFQSTAKVVILNEDILDSNLDVQLAGLKVDSLICWFIGADPHLMTASLGISLSAASPQSAVNYRETVHRRCYSLGNQWLNNGGFVHMVDRGGLGSLSPSDIQHYQANVGKNAVALAPNYQFPANCVTVLPYQGSFNTSHIQHTSIQNAPGGLTPAFFITKGYL